MTELQTKSSAIRPALLPADLEKVRRHFVFKPPFFHFSDADSVEDFLRKHPFLVGLILEAREQIRRYFGEDCRLALQPFYDPEDPRHPQLLLLIQSDRPVEEKMALLDRFDEEWWFDVDFDANPQGLLVINLGNV